MGGIIYISEVIDISPSDIDSNLCFNQPGILHDASLIAQSVKNLSVMQETQVQFLGREDLLEKEMATHSHILAWRILWTEEPGRLQSVGSQESDMTEQLNYYSVQFISVAQSCPTLCNPWSCNTQPPCPSPTSGVDSNSCPLSR